VNKYLETAHEGIYAIGDGTEFFDVHVGRHVVYGNWMNAQMQGRAVAQIIHGVRNPFSLVSSYATHLFDLNMVFIGDVERKAADNVVLAINENHKIEERFYRQGKLVGAVLIGDVISRMAITSEIRG